MNNFIIERRAIYETAKIFTEFGWVFREQPIGDFGVDAIVETPLDENNKISVFALQIKGGDSNFYRKKNNSLAFYFSEKHFLYWNAISENYPLLIILQDPQSEKIYWEHYAESKVTPTKKHWKIEISIENILHHINKDRIIKVVKNKQYSVPTLGFDLSLIKNNQNTINLSFIYYLDEDFLLHLSIIKGNKSYSINLNYKPKKKYWNTSLSSLTWDDPYFSSLRGLESYIIKHFQEDKINSLEEIFLNLNLIANQGIEKIAEFIFNYENIGNQVPKYDEFIKAFEKYSKEKYVVTAVDNIMYFSTKDETYMMDTYEGKTETLKHYIENRSYSEIYTETEIYYWREIYTDAGIEKADFAPKMLNEWESYWDELYLKIKNEVGHTDHLDNWKEQSLRKLNLFFKLYNESSDIIKLAYDLDDMVLYPMAVITMMNVFNAEVCYSEYCEFEFFSTPEWESVTLDDNDPWSPIFFIKPYEI